MSAPNEPPPRAARVADRWLCVGIPGLGLVAALFAWFGWARISTPQPLSYWALVGGLGLLAAAGLSFPAWRQRLYARLPAPRLLLLGLALGLPVVAVEGVANLLDPGGYLYFAQAQRYFRGQRYADVLPDHAHPPGYALRFPWGQVTTNAEGWRSPPVTEAKPAGTLRLLGLGDSVLFSWGVDDAETVARQLEAELRAALPAGGPHRQVEVLNTGNGSFNSLDELLVLRSRGLAYAPDVVFVLVIGNDFYDRPPYVDQVDWLAGQGTHDPGTLAALRREQAARPPVQGPQGAGRGLFLTLSYLINRSFLVVNGARALRSLAGPANPGDPLGGRPAAVPSPPGQDPAGSGQDSPGQDPTGSDQESPGQEPAGPGQESPGQEPAGPGQDPAGSGEPAEEPGPGLVGRYPYLRSQVAALREIDATCAAAGVPLVVFTFTDNLADPALADFLERALRGRVVRLRYPEDPREVVNSATDLHWNPAGIRFFVAQMLPALREAAGWAPPPGE